jgi:hypothetical protein
MRYTTLFFSPWLRPHARGNHDFHEPFVASMAAIPLTEFLPMASSDGEISANSASEMVAYISMLQLDSKSRKYPRRWAFLFFDALPAKLDPVVDLTFGRLKRDFWIEKSAAASSFLQRTLRLPLANLTACCPPSADRRNATSPGCCPGGAGSLSCCGRVGGRCSRE